MGDYRTSDKDVPENEILSAEKLKIRTLEVKIEERDQTIKELLERLEHVKYFARTAKYMVDVEMEKSKNRILEAAYGKLQRPVLRLKE